MGALGVAGLPLLVLEHPLGGERTEGVTRRARQAVDQLGKLLATATGAGGRPLTDPATINRADADGTAITITDTPEAILAAFCEREWCDGLPIVPPIEERVRAM